MGHACTCEYPAIVSPCVLPLVHSLRLCCLSLNATPQWVYDGGCNIREDYREQARNYEARLRNLQDQLLAGAHQSHCCHHIHLPGLGSPSPSYPPPLESPNPKQSPIGSCTPRHNPSMPATRVTFMGQSLSRDTPSPAGRGKPHSVPHGGLPLAAHGRTESPGASGQACASAHCGSDGLPPRGVTPQGRAQSQVGRGIAGSEATLLNLKAPGSSPTRPQTAIPQGRPPSARQLREGTPEVHGASLRRGVGSPQRVSPIVGGTSASGRTAGAGFPQDMPEGYTSEPPEAWQNLMALLSRHPNQPMPGGTIDVNAPLSSSCQGHDQAEQTRSCEGAAPLMEPYGIQEQSPGRCGSRSRRRLDLGGAEGGLGLCRSPTGSPQTGLACKPFPGSRDAEPGRGITQTTGYTGVGWAQNRGVPSRESAALGLERDQGPEAAAGRHPIGFQYPAAQPCDRHAGTTACFCGPSHFQSRIPRPPVQLPQKDHGSHFTFDGGTGPRRVAAVSSPPRIFSRDSHSCSPHKCFPGVACQTSPPRVSQHMERMCHSPTPDANPMRGLEGVLSHTHVPGHCVSAAGLSGLVGDGVGSETGRLEEGLDQHFTAYDDKEVGGRTASGEACGSHQCGVDWQVCMGPTPYLLSQETLAGFI
jgi:hypothetical protein